MAVASNCSLSYVGVARVVQSAVRVENTPPPGSCTWSATGAWTGWRRSRWSARNSCAGKERWNVSSGRCARRPASITPTSSLLTVRRRWPVCSLFAMELVEGADLHQLVNSRGPLPVVNACYSAARQLRLSNIVPARPAWSDMRPGTSTSAQA